MASEVPPDANLNGIRMTDLEKSSRRTVGVLTPWVGATSKGGLGQDIVDGARRAASQKADVICFVGEQLDRSAPANLIYELAKAPWIEGLLVATTFLVSTIGTAEAAPFLRRLGKPAVNVNVEVAPWSSVMAGDGRGIHEALVHLIQHHGCRKVAYLGGSPADSSEVKRLEAYRSGLTDLGIVYDRNLVSEIDPSLDWTTACKKAVNQLLSRSKQDSILEFDGLLVYNDDLAIIALGIFEERKISVPDQVRVIGFDDGSAARTIYPPLSSLNPGTRNQGLKGMELLLEGLGSRGPRPTVELAPTLVTRASCGCLNKALLSAGNARHFRTASLRRLFRQNRPEATAQTMSKTVGQTLALPEAIKLVNLFQQGIRSGDGNGFLRFLEDILQRAAKKGTDFSVWNDAVSEMRRLRVPYLTGEDLTRAENLWHQARLVVAMIQEWEGVYRQTRQEREETILQDIGREMMTTYELDGLTALLARSLPRLGIVACNVILYENARLYQYGAELPEWSKLVLEFSPTKTETQERKFRTSEMVPADSRERMKGRDWLVEPLFFETEQLGYVLFAIGPSDGGVYHHLARQLASSLKGALLVQTSNLHLERLQVGVDNLLATVGTMDGNIDFVDRNMVGQAAAVEQLASSIEEISRNIENTARMSDEASAVSASLYQVAIDGRSDVDQAAGAIQLVQGGSQEIRSLLDLIKDIAEQTNILAMNAAIESAHAGEMGKGFYVVSEEMRSIAGNTKENIGGIKDVVVESIRQIDESVASTTSSSNSFVKIVEGTQRNEQIAGQVKFAMEEQERAAHEILQSTNELLTITEAIKESISQQKFASQELVLALRRLAGNQKETS